MSTARKSRSVNFANKKALLCGINAYPDCPLNGCVNDVIMMYKVITEKFGFDKTNVKLMTDRECTKTGILEGLKWLTTGVGPNDLILFDYSGHGSQVDVNDVTSSTESDGFDEIICNIDLDWDNPIRDNELGVYFNRLPQTTHSVVILDCCHSGTGLRNGHKLPKDVRNRFMPPPPSKVLTNPTITIDDMLRFIPAERNSRDIRTTKRGFLVETTQQGSAILISGCKDDQTSADYMAPSGKYQGALTFNLVKALQAANWDITYNALVTNVIKTLKNEQFEQVPQLEGEKNLFGLKFLGGV